MIYILHYLKAMAVMVYSLSWEFCRMCVINRSNCRFELSRENVCLAEFKICGLRWSLQGLGVRVCRVEGLGCRGLGFRVQGSGFGVQGLGVSCSTTWL